jgi:hypothetical protein
LYTDDAYLWRANWQNKVAISPNLTFSYALPDDINQVVTSKDMNIEGGKYNG